MKKKWGFTLIELLVVISIMSILTVITVSQYSTARKKARDVQRKADLSSLSKAIQMYYTDYGSYPPENLINWGGEFNDQGYVYMKVVPKENYLSVDYPYCYMVSADQKKFALFAKLENEEDSDCKNHDYDGKCGHNNYCFSILSTNASVSDF